MDGRKMSQPGAAGGRGRSEEEGQNGQGCGENEGQTTCEVKWYRRRRARDFSSINKRGRRGRGGQSGARPKIMGVGGSKFSTSPATFRRWGFGRARASLLSLHLQNISLRSRRGRGRRGGSSATVITAKGRPESLSRPLAGRPLPPCRALSPPHPPPFTPFFAFLSWSFFAATH